MKEQRFKIQYRNPDSSANNEFYIVREIEGQPHHYFISDGKSHVGGGRLAKKYCFKVEEDTWENVDISMDTDFYSAVMDFYDAAEPLRKNKLQTVGDRDLFQKILVKNGFKIVKLKK